jgi:hypothetical protein
LDFGKHMGALARVKVLTLIYLSLGDFNILKLFMIVLPYMGVYVFSIFQ